MMMVGAGMKYGDNVRQSLSSRNIGTIQCNCYTNSIANLYMLSLSRKLEVIETVFTQIRITHISIN